MVALRSTHGFLRSVFAKSLAALLAFFGFLSILFFSGSRLNTHMSVQGDPEGAGVVHADAPYGQGTYYAQTGYYGQGSYGYGQSGYGGGYGQSSYGGDGGESEGGEGSGGGGGGCDGDAGCEGF